MFLFTRTATPQGPPRDVMAYATKITDHVNSLVDTDTTLWQNLFGAPVGTMGWNTLVRNRAEFGRVMMTITSDDEFNRMLEEGREFVSTMIPARDSLIRFVFGDSDESPPEVGAICEMVVATPAAGRMADAMAWGPEVAQKVARIGGRMPSFWTSAYGTVGEVAWLTLHPDLEAVDDMQDRLQSSDEYLTEVAKGTDLFVPGSGQRSSFARIH